MFVPVKIANLQHIIIKKFTVLILAACLIGACKKDRLKPTHTEQLNASSGTGRFNKIFFVDDTLGFVVGGKRFDDAEILTTHDGGNSWTTAHYPVAGKGIYDIAVTPAGGIYTIGFDGKLLFTSDRGANWRFAQLDYYPCSGIAFCTASRGIVVGGISFNDGQILYIDTAGTITRRISYPYQLNSIRMVTSKLGYICGFGVMFKTTDGGENWEMLKIADDNFSCMDVHGDEVWMCGTAGSIYHTLDGGKNWQIYRDGNDVTRPSYKLYGIVFKDTKTGWAVGENGLVIKSDDGGQHWMEYKNFTTKTLRAIALSPYGDLIVSGDSNALYRIEP